MNTPSNSIIAPSSFVFENYTLQVIVVENGEPWFIAKQVADILEYSDAYEMTKKLDDDEVQNRQIAGFGNRGVNVINESGLYSAILSSTKPAAKPFKKWVTSEVLPSIRKQGFYADTEQKLTQRSRVEIYQGLAALAEELRRVLPASCQITDKAVLLNDGKGKTNFSGETKEQTLYFKQMDQRGLPGIVVISKPVVIIFDWFEKHRHDEASLKPIFDALKQQCACYKSYTKGDKPFHDGSSYEEIHGLKSITEANELATRLSEIVIDLLSKQ